MERDPVQAAVRDDPQARAVGPGEQVFDRGDQKPVQRAEAGLRRGQQARLVAPGEGGAQPEPAPLRGEPVELYGYLREHSI